MTINVEIDIEVVDDVIRQGLVYYFDSTEDELLRLEMKDTLTTGQEEDLKYCKKLRKALIRVARHISTKEQFEDLGLGVEF